MYARVICELQNTYDAHAEKRNALRPGAQDWKTVERGRFLDEVRHANMRSLLEIGSGPGHDGKFFHEQGLQVVCTDLSPKMVALCRAKGLDAQVMDVLSLNFPEGYFDSVYSLNTLLHVPKADIETVLRKIRQVMRSGGLFYLGVYGGKDSEGVWEHDPYTPRRFFAMFTDQAMLALVMRLFELIYFRQIRYDPNAEFHFQSMILRKP